VTAAGTAGAYLAASIGGLGVGAMLMLALHASDQVVARRRHRGAARRAAEARWYDVWTR